MTSEEKAALVYSNVDKSITHVEFDRALEMARDKNNLAWLNLFEPTDEELKKLEETLGVHELTVEDIQNNRGRSKVEEFPEYLYVVFKALNFNEGEDVEDTINLNLLLFENVLVTAYMKPLLSIREVRGEIAKRPESIADGVDWIMYMLLDLAVDKYIPLIDELDDSTDDIQDKIFEDFDPDVSNTIFTLKKKVVHLRRRMAPQREIVFNLSSRPHRFIKNETQIYMRDIYDHVVRIHDNLDSYRDILQGALDSYLTQVSNRMNEVMKTLSIVATIILPLSFLTGLYGTNFIHLPGSRSVYGFWIFSAVLVILGVGAVIVFQYKKWL